MKKPAAERDILGRRGAAAAVVFFVSAPVFFLLWMRTAADGGWPHWSWHAPAAATTVCTVLGYFLPEKMVDAAGHLIGVFFGLW